MKALLTVLILFHCIGMLKSQTLDTIFYNAKWKIIKDRNEMSYYRIAVKDGIIYKVSDYYRNGMLQMTGTVLDPYSMSFKTNNHHGYFVYYDSLGKKTSEGRYANSKEDGEWKWYYSSGMLSISKNYKNGILNGLVSAYDSATGYLLREGEYADNRMTGIWTYFYEGSKQKRSDITFKEGIVEGIAKYFDSTTGIKYMEGEYIGNLREGQWHEYYRSSGEKLCDVIYVKGLQEGPVYLYDSIDGSIKVKGLYKKGVPVGTWYTYYRGKVWFTSNFSHDNKEVKYVYYDTLTQVMTKEAYLIKGERAGQWKYYNATGKLIATETYKNGLLNGEAVFYDTLGSVYLRSSYKDDKKHGRWMLYHPNSKDVWLKYGFENDLPEGKMECYYPNGKIKRKETYEGGKMTSSVCYTPSGDKTDYYPIITDAQFHTDLMTYIGDNVQYPEAAKQQGLEGKVSVRFAINESGMVEDVQVLQGIGGGCDEEAVRIITQMPPWEPARLDNVPYKAYQTVPVVFWIH